MPTAEEVLQQQADAYKNAPRMLMWQPPDGQYISVIDDVVYGTFFKDKVVGIQLVGKIVGNPDFEGQKHSLGIFTDKNWGMLADVVERLGGGDQADPLAAGKFLKSKIKSLVQVSVVTRKDATGIDRTNANILGIASES